MQREREREGEQERESEIESERERDWPAIALRICATLKTAMVCVLYCVALINPFLPAKASDGI